MSFIDELSGRGLLHQMTGDDALRGHLASGPAGTGRIAYAGFDPTAESLTIGNLIPLNLLSHFQAAGHSPIVLMGGATGLIGDPSGKDAERQLRSLEEIEANVAAQKKIMERLLDFDSNAPNAARLVNNYDWFKDIGFLDALRDIGKHFSVNAMMQKDSIRERLQNREQGISYTEFSYLLLQAYDFLHLHRTMDCTIQMAGSDQFGNIVSGTDLIHRTRGHDADAFGLTAPLVTKADGGKIGKTESGAVWLCASRTSPYAFYQYWINTDDADVGAHLKMFTLLPLEEIAGVMTAHEQAPHQRAAQRALAEHMTRRLHGADELSRVEAATQALFGGDIRSLDQAMLGEVFADVPHSNFDRNLLGEPSTTVVDVLAQTTLASSKREAREFVSNGAVLINGERVAGDRVLTSDDLLHGQSILFRRGKKKWHATRWG